MTITSLSPEELKEKGNEEFQKGNWNEALSCYTNALNLAKEDNSAKAVYYKNRAAVHLKQNGHAKAVSDCDEALKICPSDPKALFRRCQALEALEHFEEAYRDARIFANVDPSNKAVQPILTRLHEIVQERHRQNCRVSFKVARMAELAFDVKTDKNRREAAMNNLLILARENAGAEVMYRAGVSQKLITLFKLEKNDDLVVPAIRIIAELCKNQVERTRQIMQDTGVLWFLEMLNSTKGQRVTAAQHCIQTVLNSCSGMDDKPETKADQQMREKYKKEIDGVLSCLVNSVTDRAISGLARDALIELITRNIHHTTLNWAERLVELRGLQRLIEVASQLEEHRYESAMNTTPSTRTVTSVCLARIYENMRTDLAKGKYMNAIDEFIKDKLLSPDIESKVRGVVAVTTLLLGPLDVGNSTIARDGVMQMILVMASTEDALQQKVACECIVAAASKDNASATTAQAVNVLNKLYQSKDDAIRVRALVGLCKLGSYGGYDATIRPFADGATKKLAKDCRRILVSPKESGMRKWAVEGLSYLTLDAEVKEKLIDDKRAVQALIELAKTGDESAHYGVVATLVNLCNAYDKQETIPEMVELAEFAKRHIPEGHEFDEPDFVNKRLCALAKAGVTTALVSLSKTEGRNGKELIARVFNAICSREEVRGIVVQQGGVKALLQLALNGTSAGKKHASQALARVGTTINPETAFPGQRMVEVIRTFLNLLEPEFSALETFEALMALCNLASVSESARKNILKEGGFRKIETYMYEDDEMLKRAATEVVTNLMMHEDTIPFFEDEYDRVKYLVILCEEDDEPTSLAASGALAVLTSVSEKACKKVLDDKHWLESIHFLLANANPGVQHRGVTIVHNMIKSTKEVAEKIIETDVMEILMALMKSDLVQDVRVKEIAGKALEAAAKWDLVQKKLDENSGEAPAFMASTTRTASAAPAATTASTAPSPRT